MWWTSSNGAASCAASGGTATAGSCTPRSPPRAGRSSTRSSRHTPATSPNCSTRFPPTSRTSSVACSKKSASPWPSSRAKGKPTDLQCAPHEEDAECNEHGCQDDDLHAVPFSRCRGICLLFGLVAHDALHVDAQRSGFTSHALRRCLLAFHCRRRPG